MQKKVSLSELKANIAMDPDSLACDLLPAGSFARYAYDNKPYPVVKAVHTAADAQKAECEEWGMTADQWVEEMAAARVAMAHDMKLDLIKEGFI